jgi:hypothetical protein
MSRSEEVEAPANLKADKNGRPSRQGITGAEIGETTMLREFESQTREYSGSTGRRFDRQTRISSAPCTFCSCDDSERSGSGFCTAMPTVMSATDGSFRNSNAPGNGNGTGTAPPDDGWELGCGVESTLPPVAREFGQMWRLFVDSCEDPRASTCSARWPEC